MSDGRLYIRCECGEGICLAKTYYDPIATIGSAVGSEALAVWLNVVIEHAGLLWVPIACGSRFSMTDEMEENAHGKH
jgi:hypothetical protein